MSELAGIFRDLNMKRTVAAMLAALIEKKVPLTTREIERIADLRQPEVSLAMKELSGKGWITILPVDAEIKCGRPAVNVRLSKPIEEIIIEIEKDAISQATVIENRITQLRDMAAIILSEHPAATEPEADPAPANQENTGITSWWSGE